MTRLIAMACFVLSLLFASTGVEAQTPEWKPAAQAAFDRGLVAAQAKNWQLAIQEFLDAWRRSADDHSYKTVPPEIIFNLGLAESKIPGRELRAISWLAGYLIANPQAENTVAIKEIISQLQSTVDARIVNLINTINSMVSLIPDVPKERLAKDFGPWAKADIDRVTQRQSVATLWVIAGRNDNALQIALSKDQAKYNVTGLLAHIGSLQAGVGDIAAARKTAASLPHNADYEGAYGTILSAIALAQAQMGAFADAHETVELIRDVNIKSQVEKNISRQQSVPKDSCKRYIGQIDRAYIVSNTCVVSVRDWMEQVLAMETPLFINLSDSLKTPQAVMHAINPGPAITSGKPFVDELPAVLRPTPMNPADPKDILLNLWAAVRIYAVAKSNIDRLLQWQFR